MRRVPSLTAFVGSRSWLYINRQGSNISRRWAGEILYRRQVIAVYQGLHPTDLLLGQFNAWCVNAHAMRQVPVKRTSGSLKAEGECMHFHAVTRLKISLCSYL